MANSKLGVYLGKGRLSLVESSGTKILNAFFIPADILSDKANAAQILRGALKDNKIKAKKAVIGLNENDQFIRGFKMLLLNREELDTGVSFEAKKYIPFKTEELIADYQYRAHKKALKMDVFYVAAAKTVLEGVMDCLSQAGLQVSAVEPAIFSLSRTLFLTKQFDPKASLAILAVNGLDLEFAVIDKGFPCFSRDIRLSEPSLAKISSEIRVSLDYFRRQFSSEGSSVNKLLFISKDPSGQEELIAGLKESLNLPVEKVKLEGLKGISDKIADLDLLKAYCLSLRGGPKINLNIDLAGKRNLQAASLAEKAGQIKPEVLNYKSLQKPIALALAVVAVSYGLSQDRVTKARQRLNVLRMDAASSLPERLKNSSLDILNQEKQNYGSRISGIENLLNTHFKMFPVCSSLSQASSKGLWLTEFNVSFKDGRRQLNIKGMVYLDDPDAEIAAANQFLESLKNKPDFVKLFRGLSLKSVSRLPLQEYNVTSFEITGG